MSTNTAKENAVMEDGWNDISSSNPPEGELILVTVKTPDGGALDTAYPEYDFQQGLYDLNCRNHYDSSVVAWRTLPKPYNYDPEELAKKARERKIALQQDRLNAMQEQLEMFTDDCVGLLNDLLTFRSIEQETEQWSKETADLEELITFLKVHRIWDKTE